MKPYLEDVFHNTGYILIMQIEDPLNLLDSDFKMMSRLIFKQKQIKIKTI